MDRRPMPGDPDSDVVDGPEHGAVRAFAELWASRRRDGRLPSRADLPVEDLAPWFGRIVIMDAVDGGADFVYRLVGSGIARILGRDMTGRRVSEGDYQGRRDHVLRSFRLPLERRAPVFRRGRVEWKADTSWLSYESVHCPLASDGETPDMTIGVQVYLTPDGRDPEGWRFRP